MSAALTKIERVWVDGRELDYADAGVPVDDPGLVRGDGIFEVVRLYSGRPLALEEHLARLERSARGMRQELDAGALREDLSGALADPPGDGDRVLRIIVTAAGRRLLTLERFAAPPPDPALLPVEHRPSPLMVRLKTLSYGAHMLATRIAREAGCWEAVFVDPVERAVTEAPVSSFVWAEGDRVFTPPLDYGILDSITRTLLLEAGAAEEEPCPVDRLREADGAGLVGTTVELQPVTAVRGIVEFEAPSQALLDARAKLRARIEERLGAPVA
jgi:branched-chain amino acid aminotransferase